MIHSRMVMLKKRDYIFNISAKTLMLSWLNGEALGFDCQDTLSHPTSVAQLEFGVGFSNLGAVMPDAFEP